MCDCVTLGAEHVVTVGARAMGAVGVVELLLALDVVLELLDGRFCECPLKEIWPMLLIFAKPLVKL